jgi:hypothetical protein
MNSRIQRVPTEGFPSIQEVLLMIHGKLWMATAIVASAAIAACSDTTAPRQVAPGDVSFARSGTLRVTKECSQYFLRANDFCTITSSNLKGIEVGSTITYLSDASPEFYLETDVVLDPPGPGNNVAYGHCSVDLTAINGTKGCVFSGGTGKFKWFQAEVKLSLVDPQDPATELVWNGTYSFSPGD